jgi:flagellar protein FliO/FliZ
MASKTLRRLAPPAALPAALSAALHCTLAAGADTPAAAPSAPSLMPLAFGLVVVLALIPAAAWLMRRSGLAPRGSNAGLRVVAQLPLGPRDRVVIIEVGDRRWMLGVGAAGITRLGTLPPGETPAGTDAAPPGSGRFADLLKRFTPAP